MHLADINGFTNRVGNAFVSVTKIRERYKMRKILAVFCNRENFEYDTHALVQSFYPERHVKVLLPERWKEQGVSADIVITIADGQAEMKFAISEDTQEAAPLCLLRSQKFPLVKPSIGYCSPFSIAYTYVSFQTGFPFSSFQNQTFCLRCDSCWKPSASSNFHEPLLSGSHSA